MPRREQFTHQYLKSLPEPALHSLQKCCQTWEMHPAEFASRVSAWFDNFDDEEDYPLALKLLTAIDYYPEKSFLQLLAKRRDQVTRFLLNKQLDVANIWFAVPDDLADSATRHLHPISKEWKLPNERFLSFSTIPQARLGAADTLILFNDTYGSGKQFMREVWPQVAPWVGKVGAVLIVGAVMAEQALALFEKEAKGAHLLPQYATGGFKTNPSFNGKEGDRLIELGQRLHGKFPMGFGDCGLLLAYHFQCPNNSLPLIWADGKNNEFEGKLYPWAALFPYKPKARSKNQAAAATTTAAADPQLASDAPKSHHALLKLLVDSTAWQHLQTLRWLEFFQAATKEFGFPTWQPTPTGLLAFCTTIAPTGDGLLSCLLWVLSKAKKATPPITPSVKSAEVLLALCAVAIERWVAAEAASIMQVPPTLAQGIRLEFNDEWVAYLVSVATFKLKGQLSASLANRPQAFIAVCARPEGAAPADQMAPVRSALNSAYRGQMVLNPTKGHTKRMLPALKVELDGDPILGFRYDDKTNPLCDPAIRREAYEDFGTPTAEYGCSQEVVPTISEFEQDLRQMIVDLHQKIFPNSKANVES